MFVIYGLHGQNCTDLNLIDGTTSGGASTVGCFCCRFVKRISLNFPLSHASAGRILRAGGHLRAEWISIDEHMKMTALEGTPPGRWIAGFISARRTMRR